MIFESIHNRLVLNFSIATALVFISFGSIYLVKGRVLLGGFEFSLGIIQLLNITYLYRAKRNKFSGRILVLSAYIMSMIIFISGGIGDTGFLWIQFIPLFTMLIIKDREPLFWALGYTLLLFTVCALHFVGMVSLKYSNVQIIQSLVVYLLFGYLTYNNEKLKNLARKQLKNQNRELTRLSQTDVLTGLYNRAFIDKILKDDVYRFERYNVPFSLIMLDIDHFKRINDNFGHQKGDEVLSLIGHILKTKIRQSDIAARWGGEEFLIVCRDTRLLEAGILAEKLRTVIKAMKMGENMKLTASFGVAEIRERQSLSALLTETDQLLYESKHQGRDTISLMTP